MPDIAVSFPLQGLDENWSFGIQPPLASRLLMNVRPYDVEENLCRGGQRPGLKKAYSTQVSGAAHPIVAISQITTIYIPPEA